MLHATMRYWDSLYTTLDDLQVLLCDPIDTVLGFGHTVPFIWAVP